LYGYGLIYSNSVVSIASGILTAGVCHFSGIDHWIAYGFITALATFAVYNLQRIAKLRYSYNNLWMHWVVKHKMLIIVLSVFSVIISGFLLFFETGINWSKLYMHLPFLFIVVFYVYRLGKKSLRDLPFLKIFLISTTWVYVVYLFPLINENITPNWYISLGIFLYVLAVTIPFDIRDLKLDNPKQLTFPQILGVPGAKALSIALLFISYGLFVWANWSLRHEILLYLSLFVHLVLLYYVSEKSSDLYVAGLIDGIIALTGVCFFLA